MAMGHKPDLWAACSVQDKDGEPVLLLDTLTQDDDPEGLLSSSKWMSTDDIQEEAEAQAATREIINRMLSSLSCRERNIIRMHYGLVSSDGTEQTFGEIGEVYGVLLRLNFPPHLLWCMLASDAGRSGYDG